MKNNKKIIALRKSSFSFFFILSIISLLNSSCGTTPSPTTTCNDAILSSPYNNGLVAYYKFPNGSLADFSGNGHNGTIFGNVTPATNQAGNNNCAMQFGGTTNDYIKIPTNSSFDFDSTSNFSIVLWYKDLGRLTVFDSIGILLSNGLDAYCDNIGRYSLQSYVGLPEFSLNDFAVRPTSYSVNSNWNNMIVTYEGTSSNINLKRKIYINGILVTNTTDPFSDESSDCGPDIFPVGDIYIGKNLNGSIDDIKIYNRLLLPAEITFLSTYVSPCCP